MGQVSPGQAENKYILNFGGETVHRFEYHEPSTVERACELLRTYGNEVKILAGGTDLLVRMREGTFAPQHIVNIKKIPALDLVGESGGGVEIGASVTLFDVEKTVQRFPRYGVLGQAIHTVGSCQIRHRATLAGNVCNASPAADSLPALSALEAVLKVAGPVGERFVPIGSFFAGPGRTVLQAGEMVVSVVLPAVSEDTTGVYIKHGRRSKVDLSTVGLAVVRSGKTFRISLGAVAPTVVRAAEAETYLNERGLSGGTFDKAVQLITQAAAPITDIRASREYRLDILSILSRRALAFIQEGKQV